MPKVISKLANYRTYRLAYVAAALFILAVPLVAMQLTSEVEWMPGDFAVFAVMLAALGLAIELAVRFASGRWSRAVLVGIALAVFVLAWALLATG